MEGRIIEYRPIGGGLDYHHNSPLIGEIPPAGGDYSHAVHRSIDQLRNSLNERVTLGPLSVFSNTSVLAYSNQLPPHQHQPTLLTQQQHQNHAPIDPNVSHYQLHAAQANPALNATVNNNSSNNNGNELIQLKVGGGQSASKGGLNTAATNTAIVSRSCESTNKTNAKSTDSPKTGAGRGRKSRIYPNPNQHIVVTSNSVDNGARNHNFVQHSDSSNGGISSSSSPHDGNIDVKDSKVF